MSEYILYSGKFFTVEFFYNDRGMSHALDYYEELSIVQKAKFIQLVEMLANTGQIRNIQKFRHEDDQIYAFKPKPDRFLCFFYTGKKVIITNAFEKKADKLPTREKQKALDAREDYKIRINKGIYYE